MLPRILFAVLLCLVPALRWAQGYTFVVKDIDTTRAGVRFELRGLNATQLLGEESFQGGYSALLDLTTHARVNVVCPTIPRTPVPSRSGPALTALAQDGTAAGT